jgi:type I restriction enzyme S subunit
MKFDKIGNYVNQISNRNKDLSITDVQGINIDKVFMPSVANTSGTDLTNYKIIQRGQFATNLMHVGRDERLPIGVYVNDEPAIVSPAYFTFEINNSKELLPEYLMLVFLQPEFDRYAGFICDSSVRGNLDWERFCEIEIPIPIPEKQREYVGIYGNLLKLTNNHEKSFADLRLITDTFTEKLVEKYGTEELGNYIKATDIRNNDNALGINELRGVSTSKAFIKSKANTTGINFANYRVVKTGQFAYVADTSRRGDKIALAYNDNKPHIISSIYTTFEITDTEKLLPEFLLLWFKRPEFDRYARFNSWGSARETFDWSEMQRVRLPIPSPSVQRSVVAIYHVLEARKKLTARLKHTIKDISPILIKDAKNIVARQTV